MNCPKCGCSLAYVFTKWEAKMGELYNIDTGELVAFSELTDYSQPVKTYRTGECYRCGNRFKLTDEQIEEMGY